MRLLLKPSSLARLAETGRITENDAICPRCQQAPETELHQLWLCPCNMLIDDPAVQNSQKFASAARAEAEA